MKAIAMSLALSAASMLIGVAHAETLSDLRFQGNQRVATATLDRVAGLTVGQKVDRAAVAASFQRVIAEYKKEDVGATIQPVMITRGQSMEVVFRIAEEAPATAPILDYETLTGNQKLETDKLLPALTMQRGGPVTRPMIEADLKLLTKIYKAENVAVTITPKVQVRPAGHVEINYEIAEGKPRKKGAKAPPLE